MKIKRKGLEVISIGLLLGIIFGITTGKVFQYVSTGLIVGGMLTIVYDKKL